jgi:CMP-N-acetylneuraminic acid synthetase
MKKRVIAIIPARGGSKRLKNKNKLKVLGKPLVAWSIESATNSYLVDEVYVSSEDSDILAIAIDFGAMTIKRPMELANDIIMPDASLIHAYKEIDKEFDYIVFLQPTSPFRRKNDIDNAIETIIEKGADSLLSVVRTHAFLWQSLKGFYSPINYNYLERPRSQDHVQYKENGSIYIMKPEILLKNRNRLGGNIAIYKMEKWQDVDIDTKEDLEFAEYLYKAQSQKDVVIPKV